MQNPENMKPLLLYSSFIGLLALLPLTVQCQHAATPPKMTDLKTAAAEAAAIDASIVRKVSDGSGEIQYYKKDINAVTGRAQLIPVQYCTRSGRFNPVAVAKSTDCLKIKTDCRRTDAASSSGHYEQGTIENSSAAQKAACAGANAKTAVAKEKSQSKTIAKKDKA